jgi:hypothetical protein
MMSEKKQFDDDDGRTIADMSDVSGGMFSGSWLPRKEAKPKRNRMPEPERKVRPWEDTSLSGKERWMYALGALKAGLMIGLAYIIGLGLIIVLLVVLWHIL